jgi:hypothetical protein
MKRRYLLECLRACFKLYDKYSKMDKRSQISKNRARSIIAANITSKEEQMKKTETTGSKLSE